MADRAESLLQPAGQRADLCGRPHVLWVRNEYRGALGFRPNIDDSERTVTKRTLEKESRQESDSET